MSVLATCLYVHYVSAWCLRKSENGIPWNSVSGVRDGFKPPCECWEPSLEPLEE